MGFQQASGDFEYATLHEFVPGSTNETHDLSRRKSAHWGEADGNAAAR